MTWDEAFAAFIANLKPVRYTLNVYKLKGEETYRWLLYWYNWDGDELQDKSFDTAEEAQRAGFISLKKYFQEEIDRIDKMLGGG